MNWYKIAEDNWVADVNGTITYLPATKYYKLNLYTNDETLGTVSESVEVAEGTVITITATPTELGNFIKWVYTDSDMVYSSENSVQVTVNSDMSFTAIFEKIDLEIYDLTITVEPEGYGTVIGEGQYSVGTNANITATANTGYKFEGWYEGETLISTEHNTFITVTKDTNLTAKFSKMIVVYTVTGSSNNENAAITGLGTYEENSTITIDVATYHDTEVNSVKLNGEDITVPHTFVITQNCNVEVEATTYYTIELNKTGEGEVSGEGRFPKDGITVINANAAEDYRFNHWVYTQGGGEYSKSSSVLIDPVVENLNLTAVFDAIHYTNITLLHNVGGNVTGGGKFETGTKITITATPDELYDFIGWYVNDELITQNAEYSFITEEDKIYNAVFKKKEVIINAYSNQPTLGSVNGGNKYPIGTTVTITAIPEAGCSIYKWYKNSTEISISGNTYTFEANESFDITVDFIKDPVNYTVTLNNSNTDMGTISGSGTYPENTRVTITATAKDGYIFNGWESNGGTYTITENPYLFVIRGNVVLTATFREKNKYNINVASSDESLGFVTGGGIYNEGDRVTITATPKSDNVKFEGWDNLYFGQSSLIETNPYSFVVNESTDIKGWFNKYWEVNTDTNNSKWGTVSGAGEYSDKTQVTVSINPASNYMLDKFEVNGVAVELQNPGRYSFIIEENTSVKAYFKPDATTSSIFVLPSTLVTLSSYLAIQIPDYTVDYQYKVFTSFDSESWKETNLVINSEYNLLLIGDDVEKEMKETTSTTMYIKVEMYEDGYLFTSQESHITVRVPDTYYPKVEFEQAQLANLFENKPIAGYTTFTIPFNIEMIAPAGFATSAVLKSYTISSLSEDKSDVQPASEQLSATGTIKSSNEDFDFDVSVTAEDSRGITRTYRSTPFLVKGYQQPTCEMLEITRCTETGEVSEVIEENTYCKLLFNINYTSLDGLNSASTPIVTFGENEYEAELRDGSYFVMFGGELITTQDYVATIVFSDAVMNLFAEPALKLNVTISNKLPISLLHKKKEDGSFSVGAAFGLKATVADNVQMGLDTLFSKNTNLKGSTTIQKEEELKSIETSKPAYDIIDRGGINSVAVLTEDIESSKNASSGISYANNIRIMTSSVYKSLVNDKKDDPNTIYILTDADNL